jgi:hypothetical protein
MTNIEIVEAFLDAKEKKKAIYIEGVAGCNIVTHKCNAETLRITETGIIYIGGTIISDDINIRSFENIEGSVFSFESAAEILSLTPRAGQIVYNADGFGCVSTGVKDEQGRLVVKTGQGTATVSDYTKSDKMHQG